MTTDERSVSSPRAPKAGHPPALPEPRARKARGGPECATFTVALEFITPILGGATRPRTVDEIDIIRAASIRGHLRFWWRALHGHLYDEPAKLFQEESRLWGAASNVSVTNNVRGGRSAVEIQVRIVEDENRERAIGPVDDTNILMTAPDAYALWPARPEPGKAPARRRAPGTRLELNVTCPVADENTVRDTIRAWILFGGYGGRTRRGVGALTVDPSTRSSWLPRKVSQEALSALFHRDILAAPGRAPTETPWLSGASLHVGEPVPDAADAWTTAVGWLREFRQGVHATHLGRAREQEPRHGKRPSISNWPEADKIRQLSAPIRDPRGTALPWAHKPRHNKTPAWPRAGFGLPIVGQFQQHDRAPNRNNERLDGKGPKYCERPDPRAEPEKFTLQWKDRHGEPQDRLASALIVKPLPLADGRFVPCALWLNRAYPPDGRVFVKELENSEAPFDVLVAPGDTPRFKAIADKKSLKDAFLDWLESKRVTRVKR